MEKDRSIYRKLRVEPRSPEEVPLDEVERRAADIGYKLTGPDGVIDEGAVNATRGAIAFSDQMAQDPRLNALLAAARASKN